METIKDSLSKLDISEFVSASPWQIASCINLMFALFFILLVAYPVIRSKNTRDKVINYTLFICVILGALSSFFAFNNSISPKIGCILGISLTWGSLFLFSLTFVPLGSKWWIYPILPLFEVLFLIMLIALFASTILSVYLITIPYLMAHYPVFQDDIFLAFNEYKSLAIEAEAGLILLAVIIHYVRKQFILMASPEQFTNQLYVPTELIKQN